MQLDLTDAAAAAESGSEPANNADETSTAVPEVEADVTNAWETIDGMVDGFFRLLPLIVVAAVVLFLFWLLAAGVRALIRRAAANRNRENIGIVLARLAYFATLLAGFFVAVAIVFPSVTPASFLAGVGLGGVAVAFAFQDVFQNLLAGILILLRQPFREGDEITSGDFTGTVESIETRATFIRTYDGKRVIIPNSKIYTEPVVVITAYDMVRTQYDVGIGYGDDVGKAKELILKTLRSMDGVLSDPAPDVLTWELAGSSVNLRARWWSDPKRSNVVQLRDRALKQIKETLSGAGIDLPFPTRVVLFHDQTEAIDGDRTRQREGWPAGENPPEPRRR